ncbi:MAG TPA: efflux RND transporter periplasmic adaptor subunit [Opitutaceae bacterium]|jgi:membrane fusion protein (multidrug efflux system)
MPTPSRRILIKLLLVALVGGGAVCLYLHKPPASGDDGEVEAAAPKVTVKVSQISQATVRGYVHALAVVDPAPAKQGRQAGSSRVASPIAGIVARVDVAEGDAVTAGSEILDLDDDTARFAVERARSQDEAARKAAQRQQALLLSQNSSPRAVEEARATEASAAADLASAEKQLARTHIRSPIPGIVTRLSVNPGESLDPSTVVAEIVDADRIVLDAEVSQADAASLRAGAMVVVDSHPDYSAALIYVSPSVDSATDLVPVRSSVEPGAGLRPGSSVAIRIVSAEHSGVLVVPRAAVVTGDDGTSRVARVVAGKANLVTVRLGLVDGDLAEVASPDLKAGDTVVTAGAYGLPDGAQVTVGPP